VNERFRVLATTVAKALGSPDLPMLIVPADLDVFSDEETRQVAAGLVPEILPLLTRRG
jgi:hypothetical protein